MDVKRIHKLFARFNGAYGHSWSSRFASEAMYELTVQEWAQDLAHFSDGELEEAYAECKKRYTLAPTLPQFRELAKLAHYRRGRHPAPAPSGPRNVALAREHLAQMYRLLGRVERALEGEEPMPGAQDAARDGS